MGAPKPKSVQTPYAGTSSGTQTNTFGYMSQDPENQYVKAYMNAPIDVDPGVGRRYDLAEQEEGNRWDSGIMSGMPAHLREAYKQSSARKLRSEGAAQAQQAEYMKNALQLQRAGSLLPQMVQTGGSQTGSQSGYGTQVMPGQKPFWQDALMSAGQAAMSFI